MLGELAGVAVNGKKLLVSQTQTVICCKNHLSTVAVLPDDWSGTEMVCYQLMQTVLLAVLSNHQAAVLLSFLVMSAMTRTHQTFLYLQLLVTSCVQQEPDPLL